MFLCLSEELLSLFGGNVYVQLFSLLMEDPIHRICDSACPSPCVFIRSIYGTCLPPLSDPAGSRIINGPEMGEKLSHPIWTVRDDN